MNTPYELQNDYFDNSVRIDVIHSMLSCVHHGEGLPDELEDLLEDPSEEIFKVMGLKPLTDSQIEKGADHVAEYISRAKKTGFLVEYSIPVPTKVFGTREKTASVQHCGLGYTQTCFAYFEELTADSYAKILELAEQQKEILKQAWWDDQEKETANNSKKK